MIVKPDLAESEHFWMSKDLNQLWQFNRVVARSVVRVPTADSVHVLMPLDKSQYRIPVVGLTPNDHNFLNSRRQRIGHDLIWIIKILQILNMTMSVD